MLSGLVTQPQASDTSGPGGTVNPIPPLFMKILSPISERLIDSSVYSKADGLVQLKKTKGPWEVIAAIIKVWTEHSPKRWNSYLIDQQELKDSRKDSKYGTSKDKNSALRYIADVPEPIVNMIRALYSVDELPMDKTFWRTFIKKFPIFRVPDKT